MRDHKMTFYRGPLRKSAAAGPAFALFAFSISVAGAAASSVDTDGRLVPICANGVITYMLIDFSGDGEPEKPHPEQSACHGPCVCSRLKLISEKKPAP